MTSRLGGEVEKSPVDARREYSEVRRVDRGFYKLMKKRELDEIAEEFACIDA